MRARVVDQETLRRWADEHEDNERQKMRVRRVVAGLREMDARVQAVNIEAEIRGRHDADEPGDRPER